MKRVAIWSWVLDEAALPAAGEPPPNRERRREIVNELVQTLTCLAEGLDGQDEVHQQSVARLIGVLRTMSDSIASADHTTFSAIMSEAALLIRAVRERQAYFSKFTVH